MENTILPERLCILIAHAPILSEDIIYLLPDEGEIRASLRWFSLPQNKTEQKYWEISGISKCVLPYYFAKLLAHAKGDGVCFISADGKICKGYRTKFINKHGDEISGWKVAVTLDA